MKRWIPVLVFVLGLAAVVAGVVLTLDRGPFERTPIGSEAIYWDAALGIASGEADPASLAGLSSPLYPQLLSAVASEEPGTVRRARSLLAMILLPLCSILVLTLAWRRTGPWAAVIAGWIVAAVGPLVLSAGTFSPALPAAIVGLLVLVVLDGRPNPAAWVIGGILAGIAGRFDPGLGWALGLLLLGGALIRPGQAPRALAAALFAAAWLGGAWVSGTAAGASHAVPVIHGIDVYRGHRVEAAGVAPRRGDGDDQRWWAAVDYTVAAARERGRRLNAAEVDRYWAGRAVSEAVRHPIPEIRRTGVKVLTSLQGDPQPREVSASYLLDRGEGGSLPVVLWVGRILIPLGLAGLLVARKKAGWIPWAGVLSGPLAAMITYASPDSRQLTVACLILGAALLVDVVRRGPGRRRMTAAVVSLAAVGVFGLWPAFGGVPGQGVLGEDHFQLGALFEREARGSAAMREYERSLSKEPDSPLPRLGLALMLARDNVVEESIRELEALRERHPEFMPGLQTLVRLYERQQRWTEASAVYGDMINLNPFSAEYLNNLATMYAKMGYYDQAEAALEAALRVNPNYSVARDNLDGLRARGLALGGEEDLDPFTAVQQHIVGLIRAGNAEAARDSLRAAYTAYGEDRAELIYLEGSLLLTQGDPASAIRRFESILDRMDQNPLFLNNLAAAYAQNGDLHRAREVWRGALELQPDNERIRRSLVRLQAQIDSVEAR